MCRTAVGDDGTMSWNGVDKADDLEMVCRRVTYRCVKQEAQTILREMLSEKKHSGW